MRSLRDIQKKPSTSEIIDWIQALTISGIPVEKITKEIPFAGVILKKNEDIDALERSKKDRLSHLTDGSEYLCLILFYTFCVQKDLTLH